MTVLVTVTLVHCPKGVIRNDLHIQCSSNLKGVVNFHKSKNPNELLNDWSHDISELMSLVQKTTHLINKEEMVHKHMRVGGDEK